MFNLLSRRILRYIIMDEVNGCNGQTRKSAGGKTDVIRSSSAWGKRHSDQCSKWAAPRRKVDVRSQPKPSVLPGDKNCEHTAGSVAVRDIRSINGAVRTTRLRANLILFN